MGTFILLFIILTILTILTIIFLILLFIKLINDYKSNKIKEIIIIEDQDTTYKYKY